MCPFDALHIWGYCGQAFGFELDGVIAQRTVDRFPVLRHRRPTPCCQIKISDAVGSAFFDGFRFVESTQNRLSFLTGRLKSFESRRPRWIRRRSVDCRRLIRLPNAGSLDSIATLPTRSNECNVSLLVGVIDESVCIDQITSNASVNVMTADSLHRANVDCMIGAETSRTGGEPSTYMAPGHYQIFGSRNPFTCHR